VRAPMFDLILGAIVALGLGIYLVYALLRPEKL
jgi:K+-transporting ATPase KdpF subunit